jgi:ABC-type sugar transport system ATPase subunit
MPSGTFPQSAAVRLVGIEKRFGAICALGGVELELLPGEVHALVGENGAGKSTLIKVLSGAHAPDAGVIEVRGERSSSLTPARARELGIAVLYQHETVFPELSAAENLFLGRDGAVVEWRARRERAREVLASIGAEFGPDSRVAELAPAQRKELEIARALSAGAPVLVLDEPTAVLPAREAERLLATVAGLKARGVAVLYISHRLEEIERLADRITVLRDGRSVWSGNARDVTRAELVRHMVGRELGVTTRAAGARRHTDPRFEVHGLGARAFGLADITLELFPGEILGLGGLVGAGRSELLRCLAGLERFESGTLKLDGRPFAPRSPRMAIESGVVLVPEDRARDGLVLAESVRRNAELPWHARHLSAPAVPAALAELGPRVLREADVRATIDQPAGSLSGGNQQKLVLGKWLAEAPRVLLLDEPTQGIDVAGRADLHAKARALAAGGAAVLVVSSDLEELLALSDRIAVLRRGRLAGTLTGDERTKERVLALALGVGEGSA